MKTTAIILAGGSGKRMHSSLPKQFLVVAGKPVIAHTLLAFEESNIDRIILVVGKDQENYYRENILSTYNVQKVSDIVTGGNERYLSVYHALQHTSKDEIVLIHDGARPCIKASQINHMIEVMERKPACIYAVPAKDTIKIAEHTGNGEIVIKNTPPRDTLWHAQTPQGFWQTTIMDAYKGMFQDENPNITDDAMLVENYTNEEVIILPGEYSNIKVTTQDDLPLIEDILAAK